jgi:hypothetical protein
MARLGARCECGHSGRGDAAMRRFGSHLVTPRRGQTHHGIYVGPLRVVHSLGLAHGLRRGPVEEVPFAYFARRTPCLSEA